ncbi:protein strawberry notch homolog 1 isoform X1 [Chelonoidis abingdonii]|uniref:protein strawberry notch homolog 1 isoform X1 n=1 Tax=Chelonoidis abingdonii TaxID=106734 RepID=UPI0013F291B9|nr:protein strawberry notch homolog 1 isoform X1 [Chelonoidis abingdonii]XP_032656594.1 protein strawberry notch homolog 1 isoform X1 [Chelonoidis abingdonii]XP_032656595.1 protein strawberry notch homolog 1 isoform X1 [Chelonoidis abingdonii]XP_032656596.1 protein strawberry notch homolog 1 isoform X1 [Chelonoidis abingdonii]XP_032656597.1 protein strawberry notch homolog 1 isoform X1 [Chelonoidis abingdonii]XP_032656598.1 protein strawberry notch homolog 1 isoform X1 [Chelonoidis abingdonii]
MVEPGQDLLLAALSESGISPNDLFDIDPVDMGLATPASAVQQSVPLSALELGLETEATVAVKQEPETVSTPALLNVRQPPSTTTFVLNQINQLPTLGTTIVMTKTTPVTTTRQTITVAKIIQTSTTTRPSVAAPAVRNALTTTPSKDQVQLKDLLKNNSLNELMKLKPPPNIAQPVATAAKIIVVSPKVVNATKPADLSNGAVKKEASTKEVTRIWVNDVKMRSYSPTMKVPVIKEEEEPEEEDEEEMGHAETYAEYMPIKLKIGLRHPDPVVETSSLSSVTPPEVWYQTSISEESIDNGWLSALQLEAITYAAQQHETFLPNGDRAGFLIGDGAGVGKGRTIAGIIYENYLLGRKRAVWFSVSNDLKYDAERDLRDIGAKNILVHSLNKFKYGKISSKHNGSVKKGVIFATYSSLIGESQSGGKYKTRLKQLLHWCGDDFDGVIVFDECHKAKNLCPVGSSKPTKTGLAVLELQNKLPKARVVYASATGASEPRNMAYMNRLGIWGEGTPFREFSDFIQAVERRGVGAMEIVAMDMKLRGMYIARQLSFSGVTFKIEEVLLSQNYIKMYNKSVKLWVNAREKFQQAADLIDAEQRMKKSMWGQFWSAHQRFFKYLCIASKVKRVVQLAREEIKNGKCVVIGLQSTGEARTLEALEEGGGELNDFVSTAKGVLQSLIEKHFPAPDRKKLFSLLGIDLTAQSNNNSPRDSPCKENKIKKRKGEEITRETKKARKTGGLAGSSSDESESESDASDNEESDNESSKFLSSGDDDDFNPFRDESSEDDEDDPWLIRKDHKKNKDKKKKKSIDPDSIQSALLASGLGSKRPSSFSSVPVTTASSTNTSANSNTNSSFVTSQDAVERAQQMKKELLDKLEKLAEDLPPNTLDELIDELGGPENVAEMTGRKGRVVSNDDGSISYESRSELDVPVEILNITEKQRFMDGDKNIAIISEAASSGISLQADRRAKNQRRRVHMTLELPWSADRAIQQFGRTHRSNQVTAPEYVFLISELAGEQRFASIVAKRLESLGALTHGDRRATETRDLSRFNFDNKYGRNALEIVMKSIVNLDSPMVSPPADYPGEFFKDVRQGLIGVGLINVEDRSGILTLDKDYNNIGKFLNRILGMEVHQQNALFQYFSDTLNAVIQNAKKNGRYDMGILDLGSGDEKVRKADTKKFLTPGYSTSGHVELYTISVERGMSWEEATKIWAEQTGPDDGFYLSSQIRNNKKTAILVKEVNPKKKLFLVYRPNTGKQLKLETYADLKKKYKKVPSEDALPHWLEQYSSSADTCTHAYWRGNCKKASLGLVCEVGLRCRTYFVLCGSVLSVWTKVEGVLASVSGTNVKMQIVRLRAEDGQRIVGLLIPANCVSPLVNLLSTSDQSQQLAVQQQQIWQQHHPQSITNFNNA